MKRWITPLATIAGTTVLLATASGQQPPTQPQDDKAQATGTSAQKQTAGKKPTAQTADKASADKATADKSAAADESEPKPLLNSIDIGYTTWSSSGYLNAIHQNGFLQGGFVLNDLQLLSPYSHDSFTAFELSGVPGEDFGLRLKSEWGAYTSMTVRASQFTFWDPEFGTLNASRDRAFELTLKQQIGSNFGAYVTYQNSQDEHHFPAPSIQPNYSTQTLAVGAQKKVGDGTVEASFNQTWFKDLGQLQPDTLTDRAEIAYTGNFGPKTSAEAITSVSRIQQQGRPDSWVTNYAVGGAYDLNDLSTLGGHISQSIIDLGAVQSSYVKKRFDSGAHYDTRLGPWAVGLGVQHLEEERVRTDQSYTDVPAWNTYDLKLNRSVGKGYRLGIKGSADDLSVAPAFQTADPSLLYWNRKASLQAKISGGNEVTTSYLSYTYRYRRNAERDLSLSWYSLALGGSRVFSQKLLGYAEFSSDHYSTGGASALDANLSGYFPSSETFSLGLDFTRNTHESLSAVLTSFYSQDEWGQQIALSYRRDLGHDRSFQITYSPWLQRDRLYDVDSFDARILSMKFETRF